MQTAPRTRCRRRQRINSVIGSADALHSAQGSAQHKPCSRQNGAGHLPRGPAVQLEVAPEKLADAVCGRRGPHYRPGHKALGIRSTLSLPGASSEVYHTTASIQRKLGRLEVPQIEQVFDLAPYNFTSIIETIRMLET
jgi:hypothetical protein